VLPEDEEVARYFGTTSSHTLSQYARGDRSIDTVYGIRGETEGTFMIGDSTLMVDENQRELRGVMYERTKGLWELLTKMNIDSSLVPPHGLLSYKGILKSTSGNLFDNNRSGRI